MSITASYFRSEFRLPNNFTHPIKEKILMSKFLDLEFKCDSGVVFLYCIIFSMCVCVCVCVCQLLSHVQLFASPWIEVSRQEYWQPFFSELQVRGKREILTESQMLPCGSDDKESTLIAGELGSIPGFGRSPGEGHSNSLQYSCLENPNGQRSLASSSP